MNILFRYLFTTALRYQLSVFLGFSLLLIGQQVIAILETLPNIELSQLGLLVLYIFPDAINDIAPIALTLAILLANNQLHSQNEVFIFSNSGLSPFRIAVPLLTLSLTTGLVMTINASYVKPASELKLSELIFTVTNANFTEYLVPGEFRTLKKMQLTISAKNNENARLHDVFIEDHKSGQIITGQTAYIKNNGPFDYSLIIENGSVIHPQSSNIAHINFEQYSAQLTREAARPKESVEFYNSVDLYKLTGDFPTVEFQWRLSRFLYCLMISAIALLFTPKSPRAGTSLAIFSGILMYFAYNKIANNFYSAGSKGNVNPSWVFWWLYPCLFGAAYIAKQLVQYGVRFLWHKPLRNQRLKQ